MAAIEASGLVGWAPNLVTSEQYAAQRAVLNGQVEMVDVLVWYDGGCPLCRREIALMRRLDRRGAIDFVDVDRTDGACPINHAELLKRFHAQENGEIVSGAAAFAAMWRAIPVLRPLGLLARNRLVLAALDRIYGLFLKVRPRLQRFARRAEETQA